MHKLLLYTILSLLLASCNDDPTKAKIPSDAIERDKFVNILADIHLMDAVTNNAGYFRKYEASDSVDLYSSIFEKYNVNKVDFDSTVSYYSRKPEIYLEVYDEVIYELNLRLDSLKENILKFENEEQQQ
jgi:hypothetical protein